MNCHERNAWVTELRLQHKDKSLMAALGTLADDLADFAVEKPIWLAPIVEELEEGEPLDDGYQEAEEEFHVEETMKGGEGHARGEMAGVERE